MPNKIKSRRVTIPPVMEGFKPFGMPMREIEPMVLSYEEFEAIRLSDYDNLKQEESAEKMNISRPTFTRLYNKARRNIARAFIEGKAIIIKGGTFYTDDFWYKCRSCHETMVTMKPAKMCHTCDSNEIIQLNQ